MTMDERAFARVTEAYGARFYAVAFRLLHNRADAEDAVQRALTNCFAARADYSPRWPLSTWLYRALTNVCLDELRRRRVRAEHAEAGAPPRAIGRLDVESVDLQRALERVPREARVLLALRYVDGLSYGELARIRGISINTVKSQLARGKSLLRAELGKRGADHARRGQATGSAGPPADGLLPARGGGGGAAPAHRGRGPGVQRRARAARGAPRHRGDGARDLAGGHRAGGQAGHRGGAEADRAGAARDPRVPA